MSVCVPSLFVPHGAPDLALQDNAAAQFLKQLTNCLPRVPKAIIAISAHWETRGLHVTAASELKTIHDFQGFSPALYELNYPAKSTPSLVQDLQACIQQSGEEIRPHAHRGLDHGAWVPLLLAFPNAEIPVIQLSLDKTKSPKELFDLGEQLAALAGQDILILTSGGVVHNLFELDFANPNTPNGATRPWALEFENWLDETILAKDWERLFDYRLLAPHAERAHPTDEHLRPLFITLGLNETLGLSPIKLHNSFTYGNISMAAWGGD